MKMGKYSEQLALQTAETGAATFEYKQRKKLKMRFNQRKRE